MAEFALNISSRNAEFLGGVGEGGRVAPTPTRKVVESKAAVASVRKEAVGGGDVDGGGGEGGTMVDGGKIEALVMEKETTEEDGGEEESHVGGSVWRSCP